MPKGEITGAKLSKKIFDYSKCKMKIAIKEISANKKW
jgi:hypothetical protein